MCKIGAEINDRNFSLALLRDAVAFYKIVERFYYQFSPSSSK